MYSYNRRVECRDTTINFSIPRRIFLKVWSMTGQFFSLAKLAKSISKNSKPISLRSSIQSPQRYNQRQGDFFTEGSRRLFIEGDYREFFEPTVPYQGSFRSRFSLGKSSPLRIKSMQRPSVGRRRRLVRSQLREAPIRDADY